MWPRGTSNQQELTIPWTHASWYFPQLSSSSSLDISIKGIDGMQGHTACQEKQNDLHKLELRMTWNKSNFAKIHSDPLIGPCYTPYNRSLLVNTCICLYFHYILCTMVHFSAFPEDLVSREWRAWWRRVLRHHVRGVAMCCKDEKGCRYAPRVGTRCVDQ